MNIGGEAVAITVEVLHRAIDDGPRSWSAAASRTVKSDLARPDRAMEVLAPKLPFPT